MKDFRGYESILLNNHFKFRKKKDIYLLYNMSNRTLSFGEWERQKSKGNKKKHNQSNRLRTNLDGMNLMLDRDIEKKNKQINYLSSLGVKKGDEKSKLNEELKDLIDLKKKTIQEGNRGGGSKKTKKNKRKNSKKKSNLKKTIKKRKTRSRK